MDLLRMLLGEDDAFLHTNVKIETEDRPGSSAPAKALSKFESDVEVLRGRYGDKLFRNGEIIEVSLTEILGIAPRNKRRRDAYVSLGKHLKEKYNINLIIK